LPFFEKWKIQKKDWPWNQNRQEWYKLLRRTIQVVSLNIFILSNIGGFVLHPEKKARTDVESIAGTFELVW